MVTAIWATIKYLPIEYHHPEILIALGNKMGKTLALDRRNSTHASRTRICVEMDLSQSLPTFVKVNSHEYEVTFENIHCFFPLMNFKKVSLEKSAEFTTVHSMHHYSASLAYSKISKISNSNPNDLSEQVITSQSMNCKINQNCHTSIPSTNSKLLMLGRAENQLPNNRGSNLKNIGESSPNLGNLDSMTDEFITK